MEQLVGLLPEGTSVVAVIVTVVLFLRSQKDRQEEFLKALDTQRQGFERSLKRVEDSNTRNTERLQVAIERLSTDLNHLSNEVRKEV